MRVTLPLLLLLAALPALPQATPPAAGRPAEGNTRDLRYERVDASRRPALSAKAIPRSYALVIGIANYQNLDTKAQLQFSERDAEAIYRILISHEGGNFKAENVKTLLGAKATLANIRRELDEWLPSVAREDDRVLIYFAGHGFVKDGRGYLAPYDVHLDRLSATAYLMDDLGRAIGTKIKGKWKVLLTDACHSGAITPYTDAAQINQTLGNLDSSLFSFTASRDRELSHEGPDFGEGHGAFTYYVVRGLEGQADRNRDGEVTADELGDYVYRNVREKTGNRQNPNFGRGSFDSGMLLAFVPSGAEPPPPDRAQEGGLIVEANQDDVTVFVDGKEVGVVGRGKPLRLPGLKVGTHTVKGVKAGFEPDGPREQMVYPGQEATLTLQIVIPQRRKKAAVEHFERGMEFYQKRFKGTYEQAATEFQKALALDAQYPEAALYLARTYHALTDYEKAQHWFRQTLELAPSFADARASYGAALLDRDLDEAIRQLTQVVQREPDHAEALGFLADAFYRKGQYAVDKATGQRAFTQALENAQRAVARAPQKAEPHLHLADALRQLGRFDESVPEYHAYLRLSDFDPKLGDHMNYYVMGYLFGMGKRKQAAQGDVWKEKRAQAFVGLCDSETRQKRYEEAVAACREAIRYDPSDPYAHYALGEAYMLMGKYRASYEMLAAALPSFRRMLDLNPDLGEARRVRHNMQVIETALRGR